MTKRMVRIEEIFVAPEKSFTPDKWIESDDLQFGKTTVIDGEHWVAVEVKEPADKRMRINTSVVELKGDRVHVYRKGKLTESILVNSNAETMFSAVCNEELQFHLA